MRAFDKAVPRRDETRAPLRKHQTILIASPWTNIRRRWRRGLGNRIRVREVRTDADLEASLARVRPDVLIVDVALLPINGIGAVRRWSLLTRVLVLGRALEEPEALSVLKAGARGYCQRDSDPSLVRKAIAMLRSGEVWVGSRVAALPLEAPPLVEQQQGSPTGRPNGSLGVLTSRERQVASLVGGGARNKEIADRLSITEATVKAHLTAVFRKLAISDRLHLVLMLAGTKSERAD